MGLAWTIIQFVKNLAHIVFPRCEATHLHEEEALAPLQNKVDFLEDL
jgi:hypothetical protein